MAELSGRSVLVQTLQPQLHILFVCLGRFLSDRNCWKALNRCGLVTFPPTSSAKEVSSFPEGPGAILVLTVHCVLLHLLTIELS